jgi:hypothetical protein
MLVAQNILVDHRYLLRIQTARVGVSRERDHDCVGIPLTSLRRLVLAVFEASQYERRGQIRTLYQVYRNVHIFWTTAEPSICILQHGKLSKPFLFVGEKHLAELAL